MSPLCKIFTHMQKQITFRHFPAGINKIIVEEKSTEAPVYLFSYRCHFLSIKTVHVDINYEIHFPIYYLL